MLTADAKKQSHQSKTISRVRRRKSIQDIWTQQERLADQASRSGNYSRVARIHDIANRYESNIRDTKSYSKAYRRDLTRGAAWGTPYRDTRQYSRSTYMGLRSALGGGK